MTTLFIAEKPDMAVSIANALSPKNKRENGYIVGENGMVFTWAIGHLLEIMPPDQLNPALKEWRMETLPILPEKFLLQAIKGKQKQLSVISSLVKQSSNIVCATDAGTEGELIFYYIALYLKFTNKPIKRLWTSSLQPEGVRKAYQQMRPWEEYKNLRAAAISRSQADYLIGINATRSFSISSNILLKVGRIVTPTLALLYDRHIEREQFVSQKSYPIIAHFKQNNTTYKGVWQGAMITDKEQAARLQYKIANQTSSVINLEETEKNVAPPLLMNLTDLSREANKRFGYKAKQTLKLAQELYEKHKCITYPRTSSRHVTENEITLMQRSFDILGPLYQELTLNANKSLVTITNKRICAPEKVSDHHGLLPEARIPTELNKDEKNIYELIVERFFMQFYPSSVYKHLFIETNCCDEVFHSRYKKPLVVGWEAILPATGKDSDDTEECSLDGFPHIQEKGQVQCLSSELLEKNTSAPALYNDGSLLERMENPSRYISDENLKNALKGKGLGTDATRADTIEKIHHENYATYTGKSMDITTKGKALIEVLRKTKVKTLTSPEYTAQWESQLEKIKKGEATAKSFMEKAVGFTNMIVQEAKTVQVDTQSFQEDIGTCPICSNPILQSEKRFYCSKQKDESCSFFLWKTQFNKTITVKMLQTLLTKKKTGSLTFKGKDYTYKAVLKLPEIISEGKLEREYSKSSKGK